MEGQRKTTDLEKQVIPARTHCHLFLKIQEAGQRGQHVKEKLNQEKNLNQEKGLFKLEVWGGGGNKDSVVSRKELGGQSACLGITRT